MNPYAFSSQNPAALQGNNAALLQQMMGMMSPSGFGPQPPYTLVGMPQKTDSQDKSK